MYNAQNATEKKGLDTDIIAQGVIINIMDGVIGTLPGTEGWDSQGKNAIQIKIEVVYNNESYECTQIMSYGVRGDGVTVYTRKSNMKKYKEKYGKLPEVGDRVTCKTNKGGYFRLVLE